MQDTLNHEPQADAALECVGTLRSRMPRDERVSDARTVILRFIRADAEKDVSGPRRPGRVSGCR